VNPTIHDIADPAPFLPGPPVIWLTWWFWLVVVLTIVSLTLLIAFLCRKKSASRHQRTLLDKARKRLAEVKAASGKTSPETIATNISLVLREYLEAAYDDPALFETNEEFSLRPHALQKIHPGCREPVARHLEQLSEMKYSPGAKNEQILSLVDRTDELLLQVGQNQQH